MFDGGVYAATALELIVQGTLDEGITYSFPTEPGLNGALVCDPSEAVSAAADAAFGLVLSFDEALMGELGAISGAAYGG